MKTLFFYIILIYLISCSSISAPPPSSPPKSWQNTMAELAQTLFEIYPLIQKEKNFTLPEPRTQIQQKAKKLIQLSLEIQKNTKKMALYDKDPVLKFYSKNFTKELTSAIEGLEQNKIAYSQYVLKNITSYCIQCHTRKSWGPQFEKAPQIKNLSPFSKAQLLTATRHYDEAFQNLLSLIGNKELQQNSPLKWQQAILEALNISIRVKRSPQTALQVIQALKPFKKIPPWDSILPSWKRALARWKWELSKGSIKDKMKLIYAQNLIQYANNLRQQGKDPKVWVIYLIASYQINDYLNFITKPSQKAKALYLLGEIYENIPFEKNSSLSEFYYKSCIYAAPHSHQSQKCYGKLESRLFDEFTKAGIPPSTFRYLNELKALAMPQ